MKQTLFASTEVEFLANNYSRRITVSAEPSVQFLKPYFEGKKGGAADNFLKYLAVAYFFIFIKAF